MPEFSIVHVNLSRGFRGGERQTELLVRALAETGFRQKIICRRNEPLAHRCKAIPNVSVVPVGNIFQAHFLKHGDLIHAHEAKGVYWSWLHSYFWRTPYVVTRRVPYRIGKNVFTFSAYKKASACIGVSKLVSNILADILAREVYTVLDSHSDFCPSAENVSKIKKELGGWPIIGHIGALVDSHKGQSTLIESFGEIKEVFPNARLIFLGNGPDEELFKGLANNDSNIQFLGFKENVEDYLKAMDVLAFPSNEEALGSILLDAMLLEIPIVASAVGGIPEILNGRGQLVSPRDSHGFAKAIIEVLTNNELKNNDVTAAKTFVKAHGPANMGQEYISIYSRVLSR